MTINTQLITCILTTGIGPSRFVYFFTNPFMWIIKLLKDRKIMFIQQNNRLIRYMNEKISTVIEKK